MTTALHRAPRLLLAAVMTGLALLACGDDDNAPATPTGVAATRTPPTRTPQQEAQSLIELAAALRERGRFEEELTTLDQAVAADPESFVAYANRGFAHNGLGNYEEALADYGRSIALNPTVGEVFSNRAEVHRNLGNFASAVDDLDRAIALDPENAVFFNNRGFANKTLGNLAEALADYTRAIELDPREARLYVNRAAAYRDLGETELALTDLQDALILPMTPELRSQVEAKVAELESPSQ